MSRKLKISGFAWGMGAALAIAAAAAPGAFAQSDAPSNDSAMEASPAKSGTRAHRTPDENVEAHITELHAKLKITSDQESKWKPVADDMRSDAQKVSDLIRDRRAHMDTMNAVDDLKSYQKIADAHADGLKKLISDFSDLYDSFSPEQKKTADEIFSKGPGAMHGHKK